MPYDVIRFYQSGHPQELVATGLTLEAAQAWTSGPEASSSTAAHTEGQARTERFGAWFEGYREA